MVRLNPVYGHEHCCALRLTDCGFCFSAVVVRQQDSAGSSRPFAARGRHFSSPRRMKLPLALRAPTRAQPCSTRHTFAYIGYNSFCLTPAMTIYLPRALHLTPNPPPRAAAAALQKTKPALEPQVSPSSSCWTSCCELRRGAPRAQARPPPRGGRNGAEGGPGGPPGECPRRWSAGETSPSRGVG